MENMNTIKGVFAGVIAFLSAKLGILGPILLMLLMVMVIDYCTGMLAGLKEHNIQSRKGMWGIVKKLLYGVAVAVAMIVDWTILTVAESMSFEVPLTTFFGLLVAVWLIINELISILENLTRMEVPLPAFLIKVVSKFKVVVENSGDKLSDTIKDGDNL